MKETEESKQPKCDVMASAIQKQCRDILILHFKNGFSPEAISQIYSIRKSEVEKTIRNFAEAFSNQGYMMNVINGLVKMNRASKMGNNESKLIQDAKDLEIAELKRQLTQAQIKAEAYQEMIRVAEATFHIPIRKKFGAK